MRRRFGLRGVSRVVAALAALGLAAAFAWSLQVPVGGDLPILVTVSAGDSVAEVAAMLGAQELIRSPVAFGAAAYATGKWRRLQVGRHELSPSMNALEILDALCRGQRKAWRWVTIPEGYTLRQIEEELERAGLPGAAGLASAARSGGEVDAEFPLPSGGLEGYLFPDTYRVDLEETADEIIGQMARRFDRVVWRGLFQRRPTYRGRSLRDTVILASLVEGEAKKDGERAVIAGVLMNRLERGMKLECDATVQYALGDGRKARLTHQDLLVDSEYNTYQHAGLPPGPICSPGEASIKAAMEPAKVPHLYYVARADGSHVFSNTFAQHQAAITRARGGN